MLHDHDQFRGYDPGKLQVTKTDNVINFMDGKHLATLNDKSWIQSRRGSYGGVLKQEMNNGVLKDE